MLEPLNKTRLYEDIVKQIMDSIKSGELKPGDKLPTERELAKMVGVSRPALREALKTLEALAIIEIVHCSGIYVREPDLDFATFPLTVMLNKNENIIDT
jgi:GntR family transcriptional repressor for pyruvate dehydrogenase complex